MSVAADTWAIVAATALGPIVAVLITFWREGRRDLRQARLGVFSTLMATRKVPISREHVNSLNLVELAFYKCADVESAWEAYKKHLNHDGEEDQVWRDGKETLLAKLLFEMAKTLKFDMTAIDLFKGGYAPKGWQYSEGRQAEITEFMYKLAQDKAAVPLWIKGVTKETQENKSTS